MKISSYYFLLLLIIIAFFGCKKQSDPASEVISAKYYDISVTITTINNFASYSLANTIYKSGDAVLVYWKKFLVNSYVQIPYIYKISPETVGVNIWSEISSFSPTLFINTTRIDGDPGSPWTSDTYLEFRIIIIKSSSELYLSNITLSDYNQVRKYFKLHE